MEATPFEALRLLLLASPLITALLGFAFFGIWLFQARKPHVLLLAATFILFAAATLWQLSPSSWPGSGLYSFAGCIAYLVCALALAEGLLRHGGTKLIRVPVSLLVVSIVGFLAYFSFVDEQLFARVQILAYSSGLLFLMCLPPLRHLRQGTHANRMLFWVLFAFAISFFLRGTVFGLMLTATSSLINTTEVWILLQLSLMTFLGMLAIALLLAITSAEIDNLKRERDIDSLTLLLNRRGFFSAANTIAGQPHRHPASLLVLDIDHFKKINDNYGHAIGD